ncbi:MAG: hypothetical protein WBB77_01075, partial [Candidatus Nanopelagicales bacterium]
MPIDDDGGRYGGGYTSRPTEADVAAIRDELTRARHRSERLAETLREAREQIISLKEEVDRLAEPPSGYGTFLTKHEDGTIDVFASGRKLRVTVSPAV